MRNYRKRECGEETRYEKRKIYQYFEKKYDTYDTSLISKEIPDEMIEDGKWLLKKSTLDLKLVFWGNEQYEVPDDLAHS